MGRHPLWRNLDLAPHLIALVRHAVVIFTDKVYGNIEQKANVLLVPLHVLLVAGLEGCGDLFHALEGSVIGAVRGESDLGNFVEFW